MSIISPTNHLFVAAFSEILLFSFQNLAQYFMVVNGKSCNKIFEWKFLCPWNCDKWAKASPKNGFPEEISGNLFISFFWVLDEVGEKWILKSTDIDFFLKFF